MAPELFAFLVVLVINFVDAIGISFTLPIMVPFGRFLGASMDMIAFFSTVRGLGGFIATLWMPGLSDKRGRKLILVLALLGRSCGYFIQGCSGWSSTAAIGIFLCGRTFAGLFSGSIPVVIAYITEIYGHNKELLSSRIVLVQVASQLAGILLQPFSGSLATVSLQLPFFVCSGIGLLGLFWTLCLFQEASVVKSKTHLSDLIEISPSAATKDQVQQSSRDPQEKDEGNPVFDLVITLCFFGFFLIAITIVTIPFLVPYLLEQESFGLQKDTEEATQGAIANEQAKLFVLPGLLNVFVSLFLYIPVTKRCGTLPILIGAGLVAGTGYFSVGYWVKDVWQLNFVLSLGGVCFGLLVPSVAPLVARYSNVLYPRRLAFCQSLPMFGQQLASTIGQNFMSFVYRAAGYECCWKIAGICMIVFSLFLGAASMLVDRRTPKTNELTMDERKMLLANSFAAGTSFASDVPASNSHPRLAQARKIQASNPSRGGQAELKQSLALDRAAGA